MDYGELLTHIIVWGCAIIFFVNFKRLDKAFKPLAVACFIAPFLLSVSTYQWTHGMNNMFLKHIFTYLEFISVTCSFFYILNEQYQRRIVYAFSTFFIVFTVFDTIYIEPYKMYPSNIGLVSSIIFIIYGLIFYHRVFREESVLYIEKHPYFWLSSGILIYNGSTIFITLFYNYMALNLPVWINLFFFYVQLGLFAVSKMFIFIGVFYAFNKNQDKVKSTVLFKSQSSKA